MQLCQKAISKSCGSPSPTKKALALLLDSCIGCSSPTGGSTPMALPGAKLMSPKPTAALCCIPAAATAAGSSAAATRVPLAPATTACGLNSASAAASSPHVAGHHALREFALQRDDDGDGSSPYGSSPSGASTVLHGCCLPPARAAHSSAKAPCAQQPAAPAAACQPPHPPKCAHASPAKTPKAAAAAPAAGTPAAWLDAPSSAARSARRGPDVAPARWQAGSGAGAPAAALAAALGSAGACGGSGGGGGGGVSSHGGATRDQLPPPTAVLEFPPELEAAATCAAPGAPPQQQQQQQPRAPASSMSGRRLALRFDMPVGLDWLCGLPDHNAALGEGRLEVILGPMFAGKTTALLDRVKQLAGTGGGGKGGGGGRVHVAVKSSKDSRYSTHWVVAHNGHCMRCYTADSLAQFRLALGPLWHKVSVLAVDEAQFFPDLVEFCGQAVDGDGKTVIVAGLSGDFRRQRFGQVLDLLPLADKVTQLTSKCGFCDADALFSLRLAAGGPQEVVGGDEAYRPTCRRCYLQHGGASQ